jgi:hypothetical protein
MACTMTPEKNMVEIKVCVYNMKNFPKGDHEIASTKVTNVNLHFSLTIEFQRDIKMNRYVIDEGMTCGSSIFVYLVFGPGRASTKGTTRPTKITAWRGLGAKLDVQGEDSKEET